MYVYWWHVRGLRAVKVGHASEPRRRVSEYRHEYGLGGKDVRVCKLGRGTDAEWVERQLCRALEIKGLRRAALRSEDSEEELFALGGRTFEEVHQLLRDTARHIVFAEISNQRKLRRRQELEVAHEPAPHVPEPELEPEMDPEHEELRPEPYRTAAPPPRPAAARLWLYLVGAIVVSGLAAVWIGDDHALGWGSAKLTEPENPRVAAAAPGGDSVAAPPRGNGHGERDAPVVNASEVAQRIAAVPSREPLPEAPKPAEPRPERPPESNQAAAPVAPPPPPPPPQAVSRPAAPPPLPPPPRERPPESNQAAPPAVPPPPPRPREAAPRTATAQPPPQPSTRETQPPREQCHVSRPKPGYRVYLVTCPDSRATIGRTVDTPTGWTVSESVNGTEAIEFFMKSKYAR